MTTSRDLYAAGEVVRRRGLAKDFLEDGRGRVCALGAVFAVVLGEHELIAPTPKQWALIACHASFMIEALRELEGRQIEGFRHLAWCELSALDMTGDPSLVLTSPSEDQFRSLSREHIIALWNNATGRTTEDVQLMFKHAAVMAEEAGC